MGCCQSVNDISTVDADTVANFPGEGRSLQAQLIRVLDGDTIEVIVNLGVREMVPLRMKVRLSGIDAPEIHSLNEAEKRAGNYVKKRLEQMLKGDLTVEFSGWDKFGGREIGIVYANGVNVNNVLLEKGFVRAYGGEKKRPWKTAELLHILDKNWP